MNLMNRQVSTVVLGVFALVLNGCCFLAPSEKKVSAVPTPATQALSPLLASAVGVAISPVNATLGPKASQAFTSTLTGSSNKSVNWAVTPALGSISSDGVYTAPAEVALPENVTITATSQADQSKIATALVRLQPPATAKPVVRFQLNVLFETGKDQVAPAYRAEIKKLADFLNQYPSSRVEIAGHTDNVGADSSNQALSQRRADSVARELVNQFGIASARVTSKGYGESQPLAPNTTAAGRSKNRRVVAEFTSAPR